MAKGMTDLSGDGSVLKKVLRNGIGPVVPEGAVVRGKQHQSPFIAFSIPLQSITMDTSSILTNHMTPVDCVTASNSSVLVRER